MNKKIISDINTLWDTLHALEDKERELYAEKIGQLAYLTHTNDDTSLNLVSTLTSRVYNFGIGDQARAIVSEWVAERLDGLPSYFRSCCEDCANKASDELRTASLEALEELGEELTKVIHEYCDGCQWVIYYKYHGMVLQHSEEDIDDIAGGVTNNTLLVYHHLYEALTRLCGEIIAQNIDTLNSGGSLS